MKTIRGSVAVTGAVIRVMAGTLLVLVSLAVALAPPASATARVRAGEPECHTVKGTIHNQIVSATLAKGTWRGDGWLHGATRVTITSFNTTTGAFTEVTRVTNKHGTFIEHDTGLAFVDGSFVVIGVPDATESTGRYAGATGLVVFHGSRIAMSVTAHPTGKVCVPDVDSHTCFWAACPVRPFRPVGRPSRK